MRPTGGPATGFGTSSIATRFGIIAAVAGGLAAVAGDPFLAHHGRIDVAALSAAVVEERDHVTAVELAEWIRDGHPHLRIVDVRARPEYDDLHIPGAESVPLETFAAAAWSPADTVVLYSQGGAHAAQGWVFLESLGLTQVYFLRGGLDEWEDDVMAPVRTEDADASARAAFDRAAAVARYFGGTPRILPAGTAIETTRQRAPAGKGDAAGGTHAATRGDVIRARRGGC